MTSAVLRHDVDFDTWYPPTAAPMIPAAAITGTATMPGPSETSGGSSAI
jgi:hypothetical protein